jgi:alkylation response protein AidB-like acyl-CoA dehydrogenase
MSALDLEDLELARGMDAALAQLLRMTALLPAAGADAPLDDRVQRALLELGWASIAVPDEDGGLGLGWDQIARLSAVGGRRLLPGAMRGEAFVLAPTLAALARNGDGQAGDWLAELLAGDIRGAGAHAPDPAGGAVALLPPSARLLAHLHGDAVAVLDMTDDSVTTEPLAGLDPGQGATIVTVALDTLTEHRITGAPAAHVRHLWLVATLAEAFGAAQRCLEMACGYASKREQFGTRIVTFQAVSHRLAEMAVGLESSDAGIGRLVAALGRGNDSPELSAALSHTVPAAARAACEGAIQVHGGAGFSWELGLHLYYRRVLVLQEELGGLSSSARRAGAEYLAGVREGRRA